MIACVRTNLVVNDELLAEALRIHGGGSKRAVVEAALRTFVEVKTAERRRQSYRDRVRQVAERLQHVRLRKSPSEMLRADRDRR
jgi:Arc/MetJ family transcription regulator